MRLVLLLLLIACAGAVEDSSVEPSVVLASPASVPEVGELADYDAIFTSGAPERVEWFVDGERAGVDRDVAGDRATLVLAAPAEAFTLSVTAFYGIEGVSDELELAAVPNTAPVVTIVEPATATVAAGTTVTLVGTVEDRTSPSPRCTWAVGGAEVREGEPDSTGSFTSAWGAVAGSWTLTLACTDSLGLTAEQTLSVDVS